MMKKAYLLFLLIVFSNSSLADCVKDTIKNITRDGEYIITVSNHIYEVIGADNLDSLDWSAGSKVSICGPKKIHYKGVEKIYFTIFNAVEGEDVDAFLLK